MRPRVPGRAGLYDVAFWACRKGPRWYCSDGEIPGNAIAVALAAS